MLRYLNPPSDINPTRARVRKKRCYELTWKFVLGNPTWDLVHAVIFVPPMGVPIPHAFAMREERIYDSVDNKFYKKMEYLDHFSVQNVRCYSSLEAARCCASTKSYGPWELG